MRPSEHLPPGRRQYDMQIDEMTHAARQAMKEHPAALLRFRYPKDVDVIGEVSQAVNLGLIQANAAGKAVLEAMTNYGEDREPTINMVRLAWKRALR